MAAVPSLMIRLRLRFAAAVVLSGCAAGVPLSPPPFSVPPELVAACPDAPSCFASASADERDAPGMARERWLFLRERWPDTVWAGRSAYRLAKAAIESDPESAIAWGMRAATELPLVGDRGFSLAADAAQRTGRLDQAARLLDTLCRLYPDSPLVPGALAASAELWTVLPDGPDSAMARWRELAARFPQDPLAPIAWRKLGALLEQAGRPAEAGAAYRALWLGYAASPEAAAVKVGLERLIRDKALAPLTFDEQRQRADALGRAGRHPEALDLWRTLKPKAANPDAARFIERQEGVTLYRLRQWDEASTIFRRLAASESGERREEALGWAGRAAFRREDEAGLRRAESALAAAFPQSPHRLELMVLRAAWHRGRNEFETALAVYRALFDAAVALRRSEKAVEAQWAIGWLEYRRGRLDAAREAFERGLSTAGPGDPSIPQLLYWIGRLDLRQGAEDRARRRASELVARYPYTYYGYLARRTLPAAVRPAQADPLATTIDAAGVDAGSPTWREVSPRAAELWTIGFREAARDELLAAARRAAVGPERAMEVIDALVQVGADVEALRVVRRHFAPALERGDAALPSAVWRRAYPTHLLDPIRSLGGDRVDPFLVAGLIREESVYDPRAVSPVGALGLMQIMPDTGRRMARAAGLTDFTVDQLLTSEVNITLGVRYLAGLLERFAGNEAYAVAAYNAGPEAVIKWIESGRPRAIEEFIEEIPFVETRGYVKRVLRSKWRYETLYGPPASERLAEARP
ncbi:MAG: transglycosylase SLT domain-containing protein [Nitrospiria bacterium]